MLVTHDPVTAGVADRTLRIRDGRIVSDRRAGAGQGEEALVVDGGWLRLPPDLLTAAGIGPGKGQRARARPTADGVVVTRRPAVPARPRRRHPKPRRTRCNAGSRSGLELCLLTRTYGNGLTRRQVLSGRRTSSRPAS